MSNGNGIQFDFSSFQNIILILLVIGASIYFFLELNKIKKNIKEIELDLYKNQNQQNQLNELSSGISNINQSHNDIESQPHDIQTTNEPINEPTTEMNSKQQDINPHDVWNDINTLMHGEQESKNELEELSDDNESDREESDREESDGEESDGEGSDEEESERDESRPEDRFKVIKNTGEQNDIDSILNDITNLDNEMENNEMENNEMENNEMKSIQPDYKSMTVSQLKTILSELDLPVSGNKTKLIQRIEENNTLQL